MIFSETTTLAHRTLTRDRKLTIHHSLLNSQGCKWALWITHPLRVRGPLIQRRLRNRVYRRALGFLSEITFLRRTSTSIQSQLRMVKPSHKACMVSVQTLRSRPLRKRAGMMTPILVRTPLQPKGCTSRMGSLLSTILRSQKAMKRKAEAVNHTGSMMVRISLMHTWGNSLTKLWYITSRTANLVMWMPREGSVQATSLLRGINHCNRSKTCKQYSKTRTTMHLENL